MRFEIEFSGHKNIRSTHPRTIEITKESELTPRGDCIIGVNSNFSCMDLPNSLKEKLKDPNTIVEFSICVGNYEFTTTGKGHKDLVLTHEDDIVIRKSDFVCPRTLGIKCDKASDSLPREMVKLLQDPTTKGTFIISVK